MRSKSESIMFIEGAGGCSLNLALPSLVGSGSHPELSTMVLQHCAMWRWHASPHMPSHAMWRWHAMRGTQCHWRRGTKMFCPWWWCWPWALRGMPPPPRQVFFIIQAEEELDLLIETCCEWMRRMLPSLFLLLVPFRIATARPWLLLPIRSYRSCGWMGALLLAISASISWHPAGSITGVRLHKQRWWGLARRASRTRSRETLRGINMAIDKTAQLLTTLVRELLAVSRRPHPSVTIQRIPYMVDLSVRQVVQPQPLNVKEAPKFVKRVDVPRSWLSDGAAHPSVALKTAAAMIAEHEYDNWRMAEGVIQVGLVLLLRSP